MMLGGWAAVDGVGVWLNQGVGCAPGCDWHDDKTLLCTVLLCAHCLLLLLALFVLWLAGPKGSHHRRHCVFVLGRSRISMACSSRVSWADSGPWFVSAFARNIMQAGRLCLSVLSRLSRAVGATVGGPLNTKI